MSELSKCNYIHIYRAPHVAIHLNLNVLITAAADDIWIFVGDFLVVLFFFFRENRFGISYFAKSYFF